ncbi:MULTISPECIES: xanthine dehydrogenase family protein molybdopterin-binding subunit [Spirosoma]|uniref:Xanthine dehydrogenase family protein molybdopterin-binding subunit n=1 Tax=Spirosoma sordidisoli TaxID=2502893 RepID=A0A4Q2UL93_9BACT|nr:MULTISPECIES: xanthine dehydrogenase family protein molybdopterin-binding subunit [Spirosoma]RYC67609.1 xanthine dehydrogenase family protein molybdopterin-binding subunit [Spirosoma sordidisoli]
MTKDTKNPPIDRVDGRLKVTGGANYFADFELPNMAYCVLVGSEVGRGTITSLDTKKAQGAPGVLGVFTHQNMPPIPGWDAPVGGEADGPAPKPKREETYRILSSPKILFDGQPIAIVVADSFERATYAASLVKATYNKQAARTELEKHLSEGVAPKGADGGNYLRGKADAYQSAPVRLEANYTIPIEVHNPMELHGILAHWTASDKLMIYAKTQGVNATQQAMAQAFKLDPKNIHVHTEFMGGGFGMGLRTWPQETAVVAVARKIGRPLKLVVTRSQMFTLVGHRPYTVQTINMGADTNGKLVGLAHAATAETASYEDFTEATVNMTKFMYDCPNVSTRYRIVRLDRSVPIWMRGPGEATGAFALESAMDEMAHKLNLDPIEFRLRNYTETDPEHNRPYSSKNLKEAYQRGADAIGWSNRKNEPGSQREGDWLIGYGMSTGVFSAFRWEASARALLKADSSLTIQSAVTDIGPGTGTALTIIAHNVLGVPLNQIKVEYGDTSLPKAPTQGGSAIVSAVGSAVFDACTAVKKQLTELAIKEGGSLAGRQADELIIADGVLSVEKEPRKKVALSELMRANNLTVIDKSADSKGGSEQSKYSMYSFSVHFVQVRVNPLTGVVRVSKAVSVADSGRIVSPKTAASQMIGGVAGGIGMALTEEASIDHRFGRFVNNNLGDYHVAVHADVPAIETIMIDKPDPIINPMGAKGMGEIALIGFAGAVANAVFNATGQRVRDLPITPDKLLRKLT